MPEARVIPPRPDDDDPYVPPVKTQGWEEQLAGGLAFLRRRLTGEYEVDEFGFDPDLTDDAPSTRSCGCCTEKCFRVEVQRRWTTCRPTAAR